MKLANESAGNIYAILNDNNPAGDKFDLRITGSATNPQIDFNRSVSPHSNLFYERLLFGFRLVKYNMYTNSLGDTALVLLEPGDYLKFSNAEGTSPGIYYVIYSLE